MDKGQLRMQMLAGIITEGQYMQKLKEGESIRQSHTKMFEKIIYDTYRDASQGLIFVSDITPRFPQKSGGAVFVDENSKYKYLLTGESNPGLGKIGYVYSEVLPKSEATSPPDKLNIQNFHKIIRAILQSGINDARYNVRFVPDGLYRKDKFGGGGGDMIQIGWSGYIVESSKFSREGNVNFGFPKEIGDGMSWVTFTFRD